MAITATAVAKIAATVLSNDKLRKGVGWIIAGILSPIIVVVALICGLASGASEHNQAAVDLCFYGGSLTASAPDEYRDHIEQMQSSFSAIDLAVATINGMIESGTGLDSTEVKSIFYTLYFGTDDVPSDSEVTAFVDSFVTYEERDNSYTDEDGVLHESSYTVAIPVDMSDVYESLSIFDTTVISSISDLFATISSSGATFSGSVLYGNGSGTVINISGFTDLGSKNNLDLVTYVEQAWSNQWGYVWGTCGWILTPSMLSSKASQYPDGVGAYYSYIEENWLNGRTTDCVGLIKGYGWLDTDTLEVGYATNGMPDVSANQMYYAATTKGTISTMPDTVGLAVWCDGHIGVYIGNGYVIEAMNTQYGVVKTKLSERNFTHWLEIPYINYESEEL
ncbi:MAG: hypothetical protein SNG49_09730 [Rikenellaceae bacterium]